MLKSVRKKMKIFYSFLFGIKKSRKVHVDFVNRSYRIFDCKITGKGRNNLILFEKNCYLKKCNFHFNGNNNRVELSDNIVLTNVEFYFEGDNNRIQIGNGTTMAGTHRGMVPLAAMDGKEIIIGKDCMFADNISVRTSDSHPIIGKEGEQINHSKSVIIDDHVWIGTSVLILKGAKVPSRCIVGAKSLVTKKFDKENCLMAGVPAKVLKLSVDWRRDACH